MISFAFAFPRNYKELRWSESVGPQPGRWVGERGRGGWGLSLEWGEGRGGLGIFNPGNVNTNAKTQTQKSSTRKRKSRVTNVSDDRPLC